MILKIEPIYKERVWGGNMLDRLLGRKLPKGKVIGESWDIVDRDDVSSRVINQNIDGMTLRNIVEKCLIDSRSCQEKDSPSHFI